MLDYSLPIEKLTELRDAHRRTHDKREADRIKAVVLLAIIALPISLRESVVSMLDSVAPDVKTAVFSQQVGVEQDERGTD